MVRFVRWSRNIGITLAALLVLSWVALYLDEWAVRWRGEALLGKIKAIEVDRSSETSISSMIAEWRSARYSNTYCYDGECNYVVRYRTYVPSAFIGDPEELSNTWPARMMDHLGLRISVVFASVSVKSGVVVGKSFGEDVALPVRVWFERGGAYVPDLAVSSGEIGQSGNYRMMLGGSHLKARRSKGPYGLGVSYDSTVDVEEKAKLIDFRFQCITQIFPCLNEREILQEGERLLEADETHSR
jgi:hypothetical protein